MFGHPIIALLISGSIYLFSNCANNCLGVNIPNISFLQACLAFVFIFICSGGYRVLYILYMTLGRDLWGLFALLQTRYLVWHSRNHNVTLTKLFMKTVAKHPDKVALIFEDQKWTFAELHRVSNQIANMLLEMSYEKGSTIALFMENEPLYVAIWLGIGKAGYVAALINVNLRQTSLIHSLKISNSKLILCGKECAAGLKDLHDELDLPVWVFGKDNESDNGFENIDHKLATASESVPSTIEDGNFADNLLYIFTSGTTGLPKAAIIKSSRFLFFAPVIYYILGIKSTDIIYNPLPLYHIAGGLIGIGQVIIFGCTAVIRKKFSASNYWPEIRKHNCTVAQYVGEICRYVLRTKPDDDSNHKVRIIFGNGLRPQIWREYNQRFKIPYICEFYGATESNANIVNFSNKEGACGFLPVLTPWAYPVRLIKVDEITGDPIRGPDGLCLFCKPGETGQFVGKIKKGDPVRDFHGYTDERATAKKIIKDVFSKGGYAFLSGDMLMMDDLGFVYFKDRLGDTFRWRGENVSTSEVEGVLSKIANNKDVVVFGVEIPGTEGKAGMAAVADVNDDLNIEELYPMLEKYLPPYARPVFVRILKEIDTTGTFKLKKIHLKNQGFDVTKTTDRIYFLDSRNKKYILLDNEFHEKIISGKSGF